MCELNSLRFKYKKNITNSSKAYKQNNNKKKMSAGTTIINKLEVNCH